MNAKEVERLGRPPAKVFDLARVFRDKSYVLTFKTLKYFLATTVKGLEVHKNNLESGFDREPNMIRSEQENSFRRKKKCV